jgi:type 2A phosphatase activator TIP41
MAANGRANVDTRRPSPKDSENAITRHGFTVSTRKMPILKADPIEEMNSKLGIAVPEMIFGDNHVSIKHESSGWEISFNTFDALDRVDKTGETMLQVAHSKEWQSSRY